MLELSSYQIFFIVLHTCLILFAFAFLFGGKTQARNNKVVSYREFQRKKQRRQTSQKGKASVTRDVREVREVFEAVAGSDFDPHYQRRIAGQQYQQRPRLVSPAGSTTAEDTITHFSIDTLVDIVDD